MKFKFAVKQILILSNNLKKSHSVWKQFATCYRASVKLQHLFYISDKT